ncbi:MAG: CRISPR system precrRNA processing endoribonuclease RAMP protein Cas6 [Caldilineaceae bacterium]|nr:CRISPR system precrRNA processing endoribonuclease RAMP protein Cas6 [Caldilineaceae bacterium]
MSDLLPLPDQLLLARYRISLTPSAPLALHGQAATILRGGFGFLLKEGTCLRPEGKLCDGRCGQPTACSYAYLFEGTPPADAEVLRRHEAIPQPFVLAPQLPMPQALAAGEPLTFSLVLAGQAIWHFPYLLAAFRALGWRGLGKERVRAGLSEATAWLPDAEIPLFDGRSGRFLGNQPTPVSAATWGHGTEAKKDWVIVRFLTPARLKYQDSYVTGAPPFHVLVRSLLRRVSSLSVFHGGQRWEIDYRGWIERAEEVEMVAADAHWRNWERYSTRQERRMNLGGIAGAVTYAGEIAPFMPLLRLGELIHVGKGAVFGNGRFEIEIERGDGDRDREGRWR